MRFITDKKRDLVIKIFSSISLVLFSLILGVLLIYPGIPSFIFSKYTFKIKNIFERSCDRVSYIIPDPQYSHINSKYAKSNDSVYVRYDYDGEPTKCFRIEEADYLTFQVLPQGFAKDRNYVYFGKTILPEADPATFEILKTNSGVYTDYSKDNKHVYFQFKLIEKADPNSIKILNCCSFAKDRNYVFQAGEVMPNKNPETFQLPR